MAIDCVVNLVGPGPGTARWMRVTGEPDEPAGKLVAALGSADLYVDGRSVRPDEDLASIGLVDGASLACGVPVPGPRARPHALELRVVGGPGAGWSHPLVPGTHRVGRDHACELPLPDPAVGRLHAELTVSGIAGSSGSADDGPLVTVVDRTGSDGGGGAGTTVDGRPAGSEGVPAHEGSLISVGATLLEVVRPALDPLPLETTATGTTTAGQLGVHRHFRPAPVDWPRQVGFPNRPPETERPALNLLITLLPSLGFLAIALVTGRTEMMLFAGMSPVFGLGRSVSQRRSWKRKRAADQARYADAVADARVRLAVTAKAERVGRRAAEPDLAELAAQARAPGRRLWERRPDDDDFLSLRVGGATQPSTITTSNHERGAPSVLGAPVTVGLREVGNLSVIGPRALRRRAAAGLVLQLAIRESPGDVKIVVIAGRDAADGRDGRDARDAWEWVTWLPHCRWSPTHPYLLVGSDRTSTAERLKELGDLVKQRREDQQRTADAAFAPAVVVVFDDVSVAVREGFGSILTEGPLVGVHAICLDDSHVPDQCQASIVVPPDFADAAVFSGRRRATVEGVQVDLPDPVLVDVVARSLAPLRPIGVDGEAGLPGRLRLSDLPGVPETTVSSGSAGAVGAPSAEGTAVLDRWARAPGQPAPVGMTSDGPLVLDLAQHGPHALVAGTTRSGKSEFIKTLTASLALHNHPDELGLVFVGFKGRADFELLSRLPHAVALATDEDLADFSRCIALISAEQLRRQHLLAEAGTPSIEGYMAARRRGAPVPPLGRLVVVIDEFAELAGRAGNELEELVSLTRRGAGLGVHLILATQSPSGVMPSQMAANIGMRACFRVVSGQSQAVIESNDAESISKYHPGRGYLRLPDRPLVEIQVARVAGARPGASWTRRDLAVSPVLWTECGRAPETAAEPEVPDAETDLWAIVEACRAAATQSGWAHQAVPWPQPLPPSLQRRDLPAAADVRHVPFAAVDDRQRQVRSTADLVLGSTSVAIAGSPRTGRTSALRSIAAGVAELRTAADAHLYLLDFAGGGLRPLVGLPHVGGAAFGDWELATRIVTELTAIVRRRLDEAAGRGLEDIEHQRTEGSPPWPYLVLLIDGWEAVAEEGVRNGVLDALLTLIDRGQSVGLQAVVAGDRSVGMGRMARTLPQRYALAFNDPHDYSNVGLGPKGLPVEPPPGRLVAVPSGAHCQVALIDDLDGRGQTPVLAALVARVVERDAGLPATARPRRIAELPRQIDLADLVAATPPPSVPGLPLVLGLSGASGIAQYLDLSDGPDAVFVAGPPRMGRTTALRAMATLLAQQGVPIAVISPKSSALTAIAAGAAHVLAGAEARTIDRAWLTASGAQVVFVDDAELLDADDPTHADLFSGRLGVRVVAGMALQNLRDTMRGWPAALKRGRTGLLLSPRSTFEGDLFGIHRLPDALVFDGPAGRAVAGVDGRLDVVQVPLA